LSERSVHFLESELALGDVAAVQSGQPLDDVDIHDLAADLVGAHAI
jgi:hypothetical protein